MEDNLGYDHGAPEATWINVNPEYTPRWVYNSNYSFWTMTQYQDSSNVWNVLNDGGLNYSGPLNSRMVRPVLELSKSADITKLAS